MFVWEVDKKILNQEDVCMSEGEGRVSMDEVFGVRGDKWKG